MLEAEAEIVVNKADNDVTNNKQKQKQKKKNIYKWKKGDLQIKENFIEFNEYQAIENHNMNLNEHWTPVDAAELFIFSKEVLEIIKTYTIKYTSKKLNFTFDITIDELKVFFAIILLSGYVKCRSRKMYWESTPDTHNETVSNAMTRN